MSHRNLPIENLPENHSFPREYDQILPQGSSNIEAYHDQNPYESFHHRILPPQNSEYSEKHTVISEEENNRTSLHRDIPSSGPDSLVNTIKELKMELEEKNKEVRVLTVELNNLEIRNSTYVAQLSFSKKINAAMSEKLKTLDAIKNELLKKYQSKKVENIKLKEENIKLVEENQNLKRVLTRQTEESEKTTTEGDIYSNINGLLRGNLDFSGSLARDAANQLYMSMESSTEKSEIKSGRQELIEDLLSEKEKLSKRRIDLQRYQDDYSRSSLNRTPPRVSRRRGSELRISEEKSKMNEQSNYGYQVDPKAPMRIDDQMMERKSPSRGDNGLKVKKELMKYPKMKSASIKPRLPERDMGEQILAMRKKELSRQEAQENLSKGTKNIIRV